MWRFQIFLFNFKMDTNILEFNNFSNNRCNSVVLYIQYPGTVKWNCFSFEHKPNEFLGNPYLWMLPFFPNRNLTNHNIYGFCKMSSLEQYTSWKKKVFLARLVLDSNCYLSGKIHRTSQNFLCIMHPPSIYFILNLTVCFPNNKYFLSQISSLSPTPSFTSIQTKVSFPPFFPKRQRHHHGLFIFLIFVFIFQQ